MPAGEAAWAAEPDQAPEREIMIGVPGARLWCRDSGGDGPPVVLLHAAHGSAANWGYQQPVLCAAGYRVIAYSRRGHYRTEDQAGAVLADPVSDLGALLASLELEQVHLIGTAAGGGVACAFAAAHPRRVRSMVIANSLMGIGEPEYTQQTRLLIPPEFDALPADFRELGPNYRLANPQGRRRWRELEAQAHTGDWRKPSGTGGLTWADLAEIAVPTLLITGDADPFMPPARLRKLAARLPRAHTLVIPEAGHSCYWEQSAQFNRAVLDHLAAAAAG